MRVAVEMRKAYFVVVGGKRKRFATEAAAYYKLCAALLGAKYLSAIREVEEWEANGAGHSIESYLPGHEATPRPDERLLVRVATARGIFCTDEHGEWCFSTDLWQAYVRRVARKMRALDKARP